MKLPRFDVPNHEQTLPVSGKVFKFRPYTVKEEKILMNIQKITSVMQTENLEFNLRLNGIIGRFSYCSLKSSCIIKFRL